MIKRIIFSQSVTDCAQARRTNTATNSTWVPWVSTSNIMGLTSGSLFLSPEIKLIETCLVLFQSNSFSPWNVDYGFVSTFHGPAILLLTSRVLDHDWQNDKTFKSLLKIIFDQHSHHLVKTVIIWLKDHQKKNTHLGDIFKTVSYLTDTLIKKRRTPFLNV